MKKTRILFVSMTPLNYNSSATIQNQGIIKGMLQLGYNVDLMTLKSEKDAMSYDEGMNEIYSEIGMVYEIKPSKLYNKFSAKRPEESLNKNLKSSKSLRNKIIRASKSVFKLILSSFMIFDNQKFNVKNAKNLNVNLSNYDYIVSTSDPKSSHLVVKSLLNKTNSTKWIQYWGDPFYHDISRKKKWNDFLVKIYENELIKLADSVIYASPLTLELQRVSFPKYASKMNFVNQAYHGTNELVRRNNVIGYYGSYISTIRNIIPFYECMKEIDLEAEIIGQTDLELESTNLISVKTRLPYDEIVNKEKECKILFTIANLRGTQIPGKIYYLAAYSQPIIIALESYDKDLKKYLESFNRFIICNNTVSSIKNALEIANKQIEFGMIYKLDSRLTPTHIANKVLTISNN